MTSPEEALKRVLEEVGAQEPVEPQPTPRGSTPDKFDDEAAVAEMLREAEIKEGASNENEPPPTPEDAENEWRLAD